MASAMKISNAAAIAACNAVVDLLDAGAGAAKVQIYDAPKPAGPDVAITTQTKLAELTCSKPCFGDAVDDDPGAKATADAISDDESADATGTAAWFRSVDSDGNAIDDGTCGTADADMILNSLSIVEGQKVQVTSWTVTMPEG